MAYHIYGESKLSGKISVQGSKNGTLPLLAASLLVDGVTILEGCPRILDVEVMLQLLEKLGCQILRTKDFLAIDATNINVCKCPEDLMQAMRSSILLLGPLVSRCQKAFLQKPGGCVIGKRPIDLHLSEIQKFGAQMDCEGEEIIVAASQLCGTTISLPFPSVGVSELVIMTAVLAKGETYLHGVAIEPEICQLCDFLNQAGACILGVGTTDLYIRGQKRLHAVTYRVKSDRIVAGTYLLGAVATKGEITLERIDVCDLGNLPQVLMQMGGKVVKTKDGIHLDASGANNPIPYIKTEVFPGFATDLQSMLVVCLTVAQGRSILVETIFEDRFKIIPALWEMGARIYVDGNRLRIDSASGLIGRKVKATDLRGGAALVLAGLIASGETIVSGEEYIKRGYEDIGRDLRALGANVWED